MTRRMRPAPDEEREIVGDEVGALEAGVFGVGGEDFAEFQDGAGDVVAFAADVGAQDAVGEFGADVGVAAEIVGQRGFAVAAGAAQGGGEADGGLAGGEDGGFELGVFVRAGTKSSGRWPSL